MHCAALWQQRERLQYLDESSALDLKALNLALQNHDMLLRLYPGGIFSFDFFLDVRIPLSGRRESVSKALFRIQSLQQLSILTVARTCLLIEAGFNAEFEGLRSMCLERIVKALILGKGVSRQICKQASPYPDDLRLC